MITTVPVSALQPIVPIYSGDTELHLGISGDVFESGSGMRCYASDLSNSITDIKMNRNTILGLVNRTDISDIVVDSVANTTLLGTYAVFISPQASANTYPHAFGTTSADAFAITTVSDFNYFLLSFVYVNGEPRVSFRIGSRALTLSATTDLSAATLTPYSGASTQLFELVYDQTQNGSYEISNNFDPVTLSGAHIYISLSKTGATTGVLTSEHSTINSSGFTASNTFVQYDNIYRPEFALAQSELIPNTRINKVPLNYLMVAPYYGVSYSSTSLSATLPFDIIPLKNFKTINSDQAIISYDENLWWDMVNQSLWNGATTSADSTNTSWDNDDIWYDFVGDSGDTVAAVNKILFREYDRIYSGASQLEGYPEIHLGFRSEYGVALKLFPDEYTYFHIPEIAAYQTISDVNFDSIGAVAGISPAYSDRLYKKLSDYDEHIWWGGDNQYANNGTWLCAWFARTPSGSIWYERYYDPGKITYSAALTPSAELVSEFIPTSGSAVWDIPSEMILSKGTYYKYFHVGTDTLTSGITESIGTNDSSLVLKLTDFTDTVNVVQDSSDNNNDGTISNFAQTNIIDLEVSFVKSTVPAIQLNGNSEIIVPSTISFDTPLHRTTSLWTYLDDWNNDTKINESGVITSNYYRGGDKLEFIDHGISYVSVFPYCTDTFKNKIGIRPSGHNTQFNNTTPAALSAMSIAVDLDGYPWVMATGTDNTTNFYKYAVDGSLLLNITYPNIVGETLIIADNNVGYFNAGTNLYSINLHTGSIELSGITADTPYLSGNATEYIIATHTDKCRDLFADGTPCYITTDGEVTVATSPITLPSIPSALSAQYIACDDDTYYYVSTSRNVSGSVKEYQLFRNKKTGGEWETYATKYIIDTPPPTNHIIFISREKINGSIHNVINWILPDGGIDRSIASNDTGWIQIETIQSNPVAWNDNVVINSSDFSGYKLNKIHNRIEGGMSRLRYSAMLGTESNPIKYSVTTTTSGLSDSWHLLTAVKGETSLSLYVDGVPTHSVPTSGENLLYHSATAFSVGSDIINNTPISVPLKSSTGRFLGAVSDIVVSNNELPAGIIYALYNLKYLTSVPIEFIIKTEPRNFIENIKTLYKFKLPGSKSQFYNIIVRGSGIELDVRQEYEKLIRETAEKNAPDYIKLKEIIWK